MYTTSQLAAKLGISVGAAYELIRFLVGVQLATNIGPAPKDPAVKKKGKGENRYQLAVDFAGQVGLLMQKALS